MSRTLSRPLITKIIIISIALLSSLTSSIPANAASINEIKQAQKIMFDMGLPSGGVDGSQGAATRRGLCAFRGMIGKKESLAELDKTTLNALKKYNAFNKISAQKYYKGTKYTTFVHVSKICQTLSYASNGKYIKVLPVSTGKKGYETPSGLYKLGPTVKGWTCSSIYTSGCKYYSFKGALFNYGKGNMYNKRNLDGPFYIHGTASKIRSIPESHGCVRVSPLHADWIHKNIDPKFKGINVIITDDYVGY